MSCGDGLALHSESHTIPRPWWFPLRLYCLYHYVREFFFPAKLDEASLVAWEKKEWDTDERLDISLTPSNLESSKGKTADLEPANLGSIPSSRTKNV